MTTAGDVMNLQPISIDAESSTTAAAQTMREHQIGMLPVVRDGNVIGDTTTRSTNHGRSTRRPPSPISAASHNTW